MPPLSCGELRENSILRKLATKLECDLRWENCKHEAQVKNASPWKLWDYPCYAHCNWINFVHKHTFRQEVRYSFVTLCIWIIFFLIYPCCVPFLIVLVSSLGYVPLLQIQIKIDLGKNNQLLKCISLKCSMFHVYLA